MTRMRFGLISHAVDAGDPHAALRDVVRVAVEAERAGFDSFWLAQHHFGGNHSVCAAPLVALAAVAQATTTIRLGTSIIMAPMEHPIRLIEDALTVDALSGGRLELGLGSGSDPNASARFGLVHRDRHAALRERLGQLIDLLASGEMSPPAPTLRDRMWITAGSEEGVGLAADLGLSLLVGRRGSPSREEDQRTAERLESYLARTPAGTSRIGLSRTFHCAPDASTGYQELAAPLASWLTTRATPGRFPAGYRAEDYLDDRHILVGPGHEILRLLADDPCTAHTTDVLLNVPQQAPHTDLAIRSIRRFAEVLGSR